MIRLFLDNIYNILIIWSHTEFSACLDMTVFYVTALVVVLATSILCYFKSVYKYWKKRNVIGPKPTPFFGNFKDVALRRKHAGVLYQEIYNNFPEEKIVGIYRMTLPTLLIRDLDVAKQILIKDFEAFPYRGFDFSKEGLGDNLFHCDSTTWKALRSHMSPLFTSGKLKYLVNVLKVYSDKFVDHVESVCLKNPEQEVTQLFLKYNVASVMACSFGISVDSIFDNPTVFQELDNSLFTQTYVNEMDMLFPGILNKLNLSLFNEAVNRFCYEIVETVKCHKNVGTKDTNDVMDMLLTLEKQGEVKAVKKREDDPEISLKVTDHVMAGQVFVFFAAGTGNNTNALSYAMYHLAKDPEIQDKLYAEISEVLQRFNGEVSYDSVREMTYLDKVFYETLRMHPTTNSIQRSAGRDYVLPGTNLKIEKGMSIVISPLAIHHDKTVYPNPEQFDPERFAADAVRSRHPCAYLPFGAGPRSCLGLRFARVQFKVCVVQLLSKFRIEPSERTSGQFFTNPNRSLMGPSGGIHVKFVARPLY